jgi:hypothetical protein
MLKSLSPAARLWLGAGALLWAVAPILAAPVVTDWKPLFRGIDYLTGTNRQSGGDFNNRMVAHVLRINLADPDIRLLPTPKHPNYVANFAETQGRTVSQFVRAYGVQVAVNANFFSPEEYYLPEGTAMRVDGLSISEGNLVSPANFGRAACVLFDTHNVGRIVHTNWPAVSTNGVLNAVAGDYPILVRGVNIGRQYLNQGGFIHATNPRTALGLSQDGRTLFLMCIDGRQEHSAGALDYEIGAWMLLVGAHDAVNLDGGGSAAMAMLSSTGTTVRLNYSSAVADSGRERTVGSHFGVYAKPLESFVRNLAVSAEDQAATITWTTAAVANAVVEYGPTEALGQTSVVSSTPATGQSVRLTGLKPGTGYYFRAVSVALANGQRHESTLQFFTTTRSVTTTEVIPLNGQWRFTANNVSAEAWTAPNYNDSAWNGPGPGMLWAYIRAGDPPLPADLLGTRMDGNPATGFPHVTYYFRTHFTAGSAAAGSSLAFSGYLDDGAVFYLNGHELYRLRVPAAPEEILNETFAIGFPCGGDADCLDTFTVQEGASDHLLAGDNVLAVEVHNYSARSPDITFGFAVSLQRPIPATPPTLAIGFSGTQAVLNWLGGNFTLQQADSPAGPWTTVSGGVTYGPFAVPDSSVPRFYRLSR